MKLLEQSWQRAWAALGLSAPEHLYERLLDAYKEPHRRYHTLQHLSECCSQFEGASGLAQHPGEVEIALWFHDAVYDLQSKDNELRSAEWANITLSQCGASVEQAQRLYALVMATCHKATPHENDQQMLVDIDLSILGATPQRFAEYCAQIRDEYGWVPDTLYRTERGRILQSFLDRSSIYSLDYFRQRYEDRARTNIRSAIKDLMTV